MSDNSNTFQTFPNSLPGSLSLEEYKRKYTHSIHNPEAFWSEIARESISWMKPWNTIKECDFKTAKISWFNGATLNACYNCVDRHLPTKSSKTALIWEGNTVGESRRITYSELHTEVCTLSNGLKSLGVKRGDRVAIYMPMVPEAVFAMLACTRIGAIHSTIFAGFSAAAIRDRVIDAQCKVVITADQGVRGTRVFNLFNTVEEAITDLECVKNVVVYQRTGANIQLKPHRDVWMHELTALQSTDCPCEEMGAEDPLFLLYTSGSTGKPKGVLHTHGGYLVHTAVTHRYIFNLQEDDIYFCAADIGWITGHSYIVYGPLCNGATTTLFEPLPNYPDAGRYWKTIEKIKATIFYTSPTAIRSVAKEGEHLPSQYDLSSLRVLGTVGEPINESAWLWYFKSVGKERCPIVDTWWQTETGGILISPIAGTTPLKAGSATLPFFGIDPIILDEKGEEITEMEARGVLCIKDSWPGQMRTVYGDHKRFYDTYFKAYPGLYFTGDECIRDKDGYYWVIGRVDDVINVSGHRIGTAEVESAIVKSDLVAEAAVVGIPHEIKGTALCAFFILKDGVSDNEDLVQGIQRSVRKEIGGFAVPDYYYTVPGLPKTRSGKIMRRILRKIVTNEIDSIGDISTLSDPSMVDQIMKSMIKN